ncbi:hypothetical protein VNO78_10238 [Psophocarpus tetragonolobus]|uniref:Malic enzyme NAD-binding domain-containing protein n=1 Tax=Psophocarpus tetragonolobus TaxID=3891 RepID=A0AAN9SKF8_PSOTE
MDKREEELNLDFNDEYFVNFGEFVSGEEIESESESDIQSEDGDEVTNEDGKRSHYKSYIDLTTDGVTSLSFATQHLVKEEILVVGSLNVVDKLEVDDKMVYKVEEFWNNGKENNGMNIMSHFGVLVASFNRLDRHVAKNIDMFNQMCIEIDRLNKKIGLDPVIGLSTKCDLNMVKTKGAPKKSSKLVNNEKCSQCCKGGYTITTCPDLHMEEDFSEPDCTSIETNNKVCMVEKESSRWGTWDIRGKKPVQNTDARHLHMTNSHLNQTPPSMSFLPMKLFLCMVKFHQYLYQFQNVVIPVVKSNSERRTISLCEWWDIMERITSKCNSCSSWDKPTYNYIFPGFSLGLVISGAIQVHNDMHLAALDALAKPVSEENYEKGLIYPPFFDIGKFSANIAANVAAKANKLLLATRLPRPQNLVKYAESCMYTPVYRNCR